MHSLRHLPPYLQTRTNSFLKMRSVEVLTHSEKQTICIFSVWKPKTDPSKSMNMIERYKQLTQSPTESVIELGHLLHIFLFSCYAIPPSLNLSISDKLSTSGHLRDMGKRMLKTKQFRRFYPFYPSQ